MDRMVQESGSALEFACSLLFSRALVTVAHSGFIGIPVFLLKLRSVSLLPDEPGDVEHVLPVTCV